MRTPRDRMPVGEAGDVVGVVAHAHLTSPAVMVCVAPAAPSASPMRAAEAASRTRGASCRARRLAGGTAACSIDRRQAAGRGIATGGRRRREASASR